jgi:hypothetical protein
VTGWFNERDLFPSGDQASSAGRRGIGVSLRWPLPSAFIT